MINNLLVLSPIKTTPLTIEGGPESIQYTTSNVTMKGPMVFTILDDLSNL